uniref:Uncharacterized protein n=1 Tax=Spongospora subterranea TaxID=70186 RepID=A0A0H5QW48_9EUKA|eukprot:CRZ06218.1 hypothetical protein [Spongospora subterranea]
MRSSMEISKMFFGSEQGCVYRSRRLRQWALHFLQFKKINASCQGRHVKTRSLIQDPDVANSCLNYLRCQRIELIDGLSFSKWVSASHLIDSLGFTNPTVITEVTARRWLQKGT